MPKRAQEYDTDRILNLIKQWNTEHLDLFTLSPMDENGEFHGVIRFYFQDDGAKVSTKCIRVSSTANVREVIDVLVEKFRPDMRMLTPSSYSLYEVHVNGEEAKLDESQKPLFVQLEWGTEGREGRFLLKKDSDNRPIAFGDQDQNPQFKRKLSKREKKEQKKKDKERLHNKENEAANLATKHYNELPETSFTRSISNPEAVMKRQRHQKLEKKLAEIHAQEGPHSAGTLKIYGEQLSPHVPYKTLLLSASDTTAQVLRETMAKYGLQKEDPTDFYLLQILIPHGTDYHGGQMGTEFVLRDEECPLAIAMTHSPSEGTLVFAIRRKSVDQKMKAKSMRAVSHEDLRYGADDKGDKHSGGPSKLPFLVELYPDGSQNLKAKRHRLPYDTMDIGSDSNVMGEQCIVLSDSNVEDRHCVINHHPNGAVTITPTNKLAEVYVNNARIYDTVAITDGVILGIGPHLLFRFRNMKQQKNQAQELPKGRNRSYSGGTFPRDHSQQDIHETTFDVEGNVESNQELPHLPQHTNSQARLSGYIQQSAPDITDALPVAMEFSDDVEDTLLLCLIRDVNDANLQFKLAPTYSLYMTVRYRLSTMYHPDMPAVDRARKLTSLVAKIANLIQQTIQSHHENPSAMSLWMANASELLHFFKQDHDVQPFSRDAQEALAECVQVAFHHLVRGLQYDFRMVMGAFIDPNDDVEKEDSGGFQDQSKRKPYLNDVLNTLSSAMHLLRRCRVNAALTIQLFSQLFHFINMWLFNTLVTQPQLQLCTYAWGVRLKRRLRRVEAWAEEQGLELAADCHLCRIIQAAHLLQAPKLSHEDIDSVCSTCFKLNSLQLRVLLENYVPEPNEPAIPKSLIAKVVNVASNMADAMLREDGREILLEEDSDLQLPFLLPEDGYSAEAVSGIPNGLTDFLDPLVHNGLCRVFVQPAAQRDWTVYMHGTEDIRHTESMRMSGGAQPMEQSSDNHKNMDIIRVSFNKVNNSMGLSIVAAKGDSEAESGIYIKSVVPQGAADLDGRLKAGDQLIEVDGNNLIGITQESAADLMKRTGYTVTLKVGKQGAIYHGLAKLLSQPSPIMPRAPMGKADQQLSQRNLQHMTSEEAPPPYKAEPSPYLGRHAPHSQQQTRELPASPRTLSPPSSPAHASRYSPRNAGRESGSSLHQARSSPALNTSGEDMWNERSRATSTQNIASTQVYSRQRGAQPAIQQPGPYADTRSRSTSNLQHDINDMTPAGRSPSDGGINQLKQTPQQMSNFDRPEAVYREPHKTSEPRRDYENQIPPEVKSPTQRSNNAPRHASLSGWTPPKPIPPIPFSAVERLGVKRPSPQPFSSKRPPSQRPKSSYEPQSSYNLPNSRPISDEIDTSKVREWQERNSLVESKQYLPNDTRYQQYPSKDPVFKSNDPGFKSNEPDFHANEPQFKSNEPQFQDKPKFHGNDSQYQANEAQYKSNRPVEQFKANELQLQSSDTLISSQDSQLQNNESPIHIQDRRYRPNEMQLDETKFPLDQTSYRSPHIAHATSTNLYENMTPRAREDAHFTAPRSPNYANQETMDNQRELLEPRSPQSLVGPPADNQRLYVVKDNRNLLDLRSRFPPNTSLNDTSEKNREARRDNFDDQIPASQQPEYYPAQWQTGYPPPPPLHQHQDKSVYYNDQVAPHQEDVPPLPPPPQESYVHTSLSLEDKINAEQERMLNAHASYNDKNTNQESLSSQTPYQVTRDSQRISGNFQPDHTQFLIQDQPNNTYVNTQQRMNPYANDSMHNYQNISKLSEQPSELDNRVQPSFMSEKTGPPPPVKPKPKVKPGVSSQPLPQQESVVLYQSMQSSDQSIHESNRLQLINLEIAELDAIAPQLNTQQESRLQNLKLEQEFQRRLEEAESREDEDSDDERAERRMNREMLHQALIEDIEKTKAHLLELHRQQCFREFELEKEHMERLHQRLRVYEEDQELQRERQSRRQEVKRKTQEDNQRKHREQKEKQRQEFEENRKLLMREEEKKRLRQEAEAARRKEWEKEKLREMQAAKDAEEDALRAEARRRKEEASARRLEEQNHARKLEDRRVSVQDEIIRLDDTLPPPPDAHRYHEQSGQTDQQAIFSNNQKYTQDPSQFHQQSYTTQQNSGYQPQQQLGYYPLSQKSEPPPSYQQPPQSNYQPPQSSHPAQQMNYQPPQSSYQPSVSSYPQQPLSHQQQFQHQQQLPYNQAYQPRTPASYNQRPSSPSTPNTAQINGPDIPEPYAYNRQTPYNTNPYSENLPAPPPPERKSSYNNMARHRNSAHEQSTQDFRQPMPSSRSLQDMSTSNKKSVSFNTQLETRNTYSVGSTDDRSSATSSIHPSLSDSPQSNSRFSYSDPDSSDVFTSPSQHSNNVRYTTADTPTVIGAQEIYRDPRNRIEATRPIMRKTGPEKMSFKEKMKYFAAEAGESTPKERPKSSRSQRDIESNIFNGQ